MGWKHLEIGLEEMVKFVKGFVDILILSSGYQSSGRLAHWDARNIKSAFHWALFFERVLSELKNSDNYDESAEELDAALSETKSQASFPQGLAHISSDTLLHARGFIAEHITQTLPLRDAHLKAVLIAAVELDIEDLPEVAHDCLSRYLDKLSLQNNSIDSFRGCGPSGEKADVEIENLDSYDWTSTIIRELSKRQSAVSGISSLRKGLCVFSKTTIRNSVPFQVNSSVEREQSKYEKFSWSEEEVAEIITWNRWKSKSLLYFLDSRTIRLVSGASMMFSSQKSQWLRVFGCLAKPENLHERVELLLLGCIADRWASIIKHFQTVSFDCLATLDRFSEVHKLLLGRSQIPLLREESANSKESSILNHLMELLGDDLQVLWKLSPALLAAAIPSWSTLLKGYLNQIEICLKGQSVGLRCCGCTEERKEHKDCELAERIWCVYAFHVSSSLANVNSFSS